MRIVLFFLCLFLWLPAAAQPPAKSASELQSRLDQILTRAVREQNLPGAAVMVDIPRVGRLVSTAGVSDTRRRVARDEVQPFRIASITKSMTATVILLLVEEGKLSYEDTVSKWYPQFPNGDKITIRDLLRMRSGMADAADKPFLLEYAAHPLLNFSADDMIGRTAARRAEFKAPDSETVYNNTNFVLLERIAHKVTGQEMHELFREKIFLPLNMTDSYYPAPGDTHLAGSLHGYALQDGVLRDVTVLNPVPAGGAGAVVSSLRDLSIWARALAQGTLLKPETQRQRMISSHLVGVANYVSYGEGVEILGNFVGHNGTIAGFSTECYYLPQLDATLVISVNRLDGDDVSRSAHLFAAITRAVFPEWLKW